MPLLNQLHAILSHQSSAHRILFMPVRPQWDKYIRMLVRLANAGYVVVAADTYQGPFPFSIEGGELINSQTCPPKKLVRTLWASWQLGTSSTLCSQCGCGCALQAKHCSRLLCFAAPRAPTQPWHFRLQVPSAAALSAFTQNLDQFAEALGPKSGTDPEMVLVGSREGAYAAMLVASGEPWAGHGLSRLSGACRAVALLTDCQLLLQCRLVQGSAMNSRS